MVQPLFIGEKQANNKLQAHNNITFAILFRNSFLQQPNETGLFSYINCKVIKWMAITLTDIDDDQ